MMSAKGRVKAQYRLGSRRSCVFRCSGNNSLQRGIPALDARDKKFRTPLDKLLDKLSRISKETFHADFP
jgi:hypothetical protein